MRAYDGGVVLRYMLPPFGTGFRIQSEGTEFRFARAYDCFGLNLGTFGNSHEGEFDPVNSGKIRPFHLFDAPLVCKTGTGSETIALAEADKQDYAGAYFSGFLDGAPGVGIRLSPRHDGRPDNAPAPPPVIVAQPAGPFATPWRVIMTGDTPGTLVESSLIPVLARPGALKDTAWIRPGKGPGTGGTDGRWMFQIQVSTPPRTRPISISLLR